MGGAFTRLHEPVRCAWSQQIAAMAITPAKLLSYSPSEDVHLALSCTLTKPKSRPWLSEGECRLAPQEVPGEEENSGCERATDLGENCHVEDADASR